MRNIVDYIASYNDCIIEDDTVKVYNEASGEIEKFDTNGFKELVKAMIKKELNKE